MNPGGAPGTPPEIPPATVPRTPPGTAQERGSGATPDAALPDAAATGEPPRYWAWTDRWDPGKWETPDNPTPLQRTLAWIALVIVLVMTVYVPLKVLKFF